MLTPFAATGTFRDPSEHWLIKEHPLLLLRVVLFAVLLSHCYLAFTKESRCMHLHVLSLHCSLYVFAIIIPSRKKSIGSCRIPSETYRKRKPIEIRSSARLYWPIMIRRSDSKEALKWVCAACLPQLSRSISVFIRDFEGSDACEAGGRSSQLELRFKKLYFTDSGIGSGLYPY